MSIEARQIQKTLYSQGLRAKFGACSVQNAQLFKNTITMLTLPLVFII